MFKSVKILLKEQWLEKDFYSGAALGLYFVAFILFIVFIGFLFPLWFSFSHNTQSLTDGFGITSDVGNTINGILTPFVGSLAVATTFFAFLVQYKANKLQRDDIKKRKI